MPGGYQVFDIKQGGMGIVYLANQPQLRRRFAIKSFQDKYFANNESVERFRREARTWIALGQHRHIVRAIFVKRIDNKPHIFLDYIDGPSLQERIEQGPLSLRLVLDIALQFCEGMCYAMAKLGVVHRDIKPANIMLTADGLVKITDFGLGMGSARRGSADPSRDSGPGFDRSDAGLTAHGAGMGTMGYMPPEQWTDARGVDVRADIYSFGVTLYEMLCRRRPFPLTPGEPAAALYKKQISSLPTPPNHARRDVPEGLTGLVLRCLDKAPEMRFPHFEEVRRSLMSIYENAFAKAWTSLPDPSGQEGFSSQLALEGMSYAALEDHRAAVTRYTEALRLEPDNAYLMRMTGESYLRMEDYREAMTWLVKAGSHGGKDADLCADMAHCLNSLDQHETALEHAELSVRLEPRLSSGWNNKGIALFHLGRVEEADLAPRNAIGLDPNCEESWNNRGFLLGRRGNLEEAARCLRQAIGLNPRYSQPYLNYSELLCGMGRVKEGLKVIEDLLALDPQNRKAETVRVALTDFLHRRPV